MQFLGAEDLLQPVFVFDIQRGAMGQTETSQTLVSRSRSDPWSPGVFFGREAASISIGPLAAICIHCWDFGPIFLWLKWSMSDPPHVTRRESSPRARTSTLQEGATRASLDFGRGRREGRCVVWCFPAFSRKVWEELLKHERTCKRLYATRCAPHTLLLGRIVFIRNAFGRIILSRMESLELEIQKDCLDIL